MADRHVDMSLLNAYVDGELEGDDRIRIEALADRDADVARQLAVLTSLKSATVTAVEERSIRLPSPQRQRWATPLVAACFALAFIATAIGWHLFQVAPAGELAFARAAHASWADINTGVSPLPVSAPPAMAEAYLPDLAPAKLQLAHLKIWRETAGQTLVAGYLGTRGCRVTLLVHRDGTAGDGELQHANESGLFVSRWRIGGLQYAMVAEGMARERFRTIVDGVRSGSLRHAPMDEKTRMALARSRALSPPCRVG